MRLEPLRVVHAERLLAFELAHRAYFEAHINARPASYYSEAGVQQAICDAEAQREADQAHAYLVFDAELLVARVNLTRVRRSHWHSAELGYRVAQDQTGRGVAREAVRQLLALAFGPLGLRRVEAQTHERNAPSARVLAHNGFEVFGRSRRSFLLGDDWLDVFHHERHAP